MLIAAPGATFKAAGSTLCARSELHARASTRTGAEDLRKELLAHGLVAAPSPECGDKRAARD